MSFIDLISGVLNPAKDIIDEVVTSKEEKMTLTNALKKIEFQSMERALDYEKERVKQQASIVRSEAQGQSWLQRNWRPITMLTFLILVCLDSLGYLKYRLSEQAWTLLQIGMSGYIIGRSAEKVAPKLKGMITKKSN